MLPIDAELKRLCEPISEAAPAGSDLSFDGEFEAIALEVGKLERVDGRSPDWA